MRDIAGEESEAQAADVEAVLKQIGAGADSERAIVEVWNKIDLLPAEDREQLLARPQRRDGSGVPVVALSAITGEGCDRLTEFLAELLDKGAPIEARLGPDDGEALAWLYRHGRVLSRSDDGSGHVSLEVRLDAQALGQFERRFPGALLREAVA